MHDADDRCACALGERRKRRESPPTAMVFMRVNVAADRCPTTGSRTIRFARIVRGRLGTGGLDGTSGLCRVRAARPKALPSYYLQNTWSGLIQRSSSMMQVARVSRPLQSVACA